ncbi:hypothetical protein D9M73_110920 [compost metagenome]
MAVVNLVEQRVGLVLRTMVDGQRATGSEALGIMRCGGDGALVAIGEQRDPGGAIGRWQQPRFDETDPVKIGHRHDCVRAMLGQPPRLDAPAWPRSTCRADRHRLGFGGRADAVAHHQDDAIDL